MCLWFGRIGQVAFIAFCFVFLFCKAQDNYIDKGRNKNPWGLGLHFRRRLFHERNSPATPVCIPDLNCYVCSEEDDVRCGDPDPPMQYLKSCKTIIPCTTDSFVSAETLSQSYLCYKAFDPYTRKQSRSCQTTTSLPEWNSAYSSNGCTTSRLINPAGKIGTRCICNTNGCNGGSIYIPTEDEYSKASVKTSTFFLPPFLVIVNLIILELE